MHNFLGSIHYIMASNDIDEYTNNKVYSIVINNHRWGANSFPRFTVNNISEISYRHYANWLFDYIYIYIFLHDWPWISPWIKSISNELDITIHVIAAQLSCYCDVMSNRLWRHQQGEDWVSETRGRCVKIVVLSSFMYSLYRVRNKIMYVLSWRTVSALTRVLFLCL